MYEWERLAESILSASQFQKLTKSSTKGVAHRKICAFPFHVSYSKTGSIGSPSTDHSFFATVYRGPTLFNRIDAFDANRLFESGAYYYRKRFPKKQVTFWPIGKVLHAITSKD